MKDYFPGYCECGAKCAPGRDYCSLECVKRRKDAVDVAALLVVAVIVLAVIGVGVALRLCAS